MNYDWEDTYSHNHLFWRDTVVQETTFVLTGQIYENAPKETSQIKKEKLHCGKFHNKIHKDYWRQQS